MGMTRVIHIDKRASSSRCVIYLLIVTLTRTMIVIALARRIIAADLGIWVTDLSKSLPSLARRVTMQIKKVVLPHPRLVVFLDINDTTGGRNRRMIVY